MLTAILIHFIDVKHMTTIGTRNKSIGKLSGSIFWDIGDIGYCSVGDISDSC